MKNVKTSQRCKHVKNVKTYLHLKDATCVMALGYLERLVWTWDHERGNLNLVSGGPGKGEVPLH